MWNDVDELVRILSAGVNVVASASFVTGHNLGEGRERILEACRTGGSTMFGSGVSPGFAELLAIVATTACDRVDKVTIAESADTTLYDSPTPRGRAASACRSTIRSCREWRPREPPSSPRPCGWRPTLLGVELDEVVCEAEYAQTTEDLVMASWTIPAGCVPACTRAGRAGLARRRSST